MLVLSRRQNETIVFPDLETTIQVVNIKSGVVRLGIAAPEHIRVLRGELPDRETEWADTPAKSNPAAPRLNDLVQKRLAIVRRGLDEVQRSMAAATTEEAELLLDKLDEDLHLLRQRLHNEARTQPRSLLLRREPCTCAGDILDGDNCRCADDHPPAR
jgi:two-component system, OmpR family, response regulator